MMGRRAEPPSPDWQTQPATEICAVLEPSGEPRASGSPALGVGAHPAGSIWEDHADDDVPTAAVPTAGILVG